MSGPRFGSYFLAGSHDRFALASIVPEIDQVVVGLKLVSFLDPIISGDAAKNLETIVLPIYRQMDPEILALGSEMGQAYDDVWGRSFDAGHYYLATPPRGLTGSPAIIFVHGSAGNFVSYLWALRSLSQQHGFAVAHPSFGFGMWSRKGGVEAIESPAWRDRSILVLEGAEDDRVPQMYADRVVAQLRAKGALVDYRVYEGHDHFLLFSALDRAVADLAAWATSPAPGQE